MDTGNALYSKRGDEFVLKGLLYVVITDSFWSQLVPGTRVC